jgi:signal transduction histidine kinase
MIEPDEIINEILLRLGDKLEELNAQVEFKDLYPVMADPQLFSRLLSLLIDHGLKSRKMAVTPKLRIRSSKADELNSIPTAKKNMPYTILSVSDNGTGFTESEAEHIFELFHGLRSENKGKGSGVGLAICRKIMELHGGFITAEAVRAVGATFNCYFPLK